MCIHYSGRKIDAKQTQPILAVFPSSLYVLILERSPKLNMPVVNLTFYNKLHMYFFVFIFIRLFAFNKQVAVGSHRHDCYLLAKSASLPNQVACFEPSSTNNLIAC